MRSAAVLGASPVRSRFSNKAIRAFLAANWTVFPIHPRESEVEGIACLADVASLPTSPNVISVYVSPGILLGELAGIAAKGCDELWLNPGSHTPEVVDAARRLGLSVVLDCTLLRLGRLPEEFD